MDFIAGGAIPYSFASKKIAVALIICSLPFLVFCFFLVRNGINSLKTRFFKSLLQILLGVLCLLWVILLANGYFKTVISGGGIQW
jgi:type IV secretory pathway TrbL component